MHPTNVYDLRLGRATPSTPTRDWRQVARSARATSRHHLRELHQRHKRQESHRGGHHPRVEIRRTAHHLAHLNALDTRQRAREISTTSRCLASAFANVARADRATWRQSRVGVEGVARPRRRS